MIRLAALAALLPAIVYGYGVPWPASLPVGSRPTVDVGYAVYVGNDSLSDVTFFGNIPYITAPLGDLRWRKPQMLDESPSSGRVIDARAFGPICIQQPAIAGVGQEDCVTLNIWAPTGAKAGDELPVMVYIHGGGNYYNSAQGFPMQDWVNITGGNLIAVNIQYRLGLLGFLASQEIIDNGVPNGGLYDQRAALEWIQRHIAKFGGDPSHVTIDGESSGGGSVVNHLVWGGGEAAPPFSAAVMQSIGNDPFHPQAIWETCYQSVVKFTGCDGAPDALTCLRQTAVDTLIGAVDHRPQPLCKYLPVIDNEIFTGYPSQLIGQGKFAKGPVMAGHCTDDGTIFAGSVTTYDNRQRLDAVHRADRYETYETFQQGLALYNQSDFTSFWDLAQTLAGETEFTCLDWYLAENAEKYNSSSYLFRWNTPDPVQLAAGPSRGVLHTSDLYFLFDGTNSGVSSSQVSNTFRPFNATEQPLANEAVSYWSSFGRQYNPSAFKQAYSPDWLESSGGQKRVVPTEGTANGTATVVEDVPDAYKKRCSFWMSKAVTDETHI